MGMNLEQKLNGSLKEVLKTSGYVFEFINNKKIQSNAITTSNNQLIPPSIVAKLSNSLSQFDDILDETVSKLNDSKWCVENMLDNKQKQEAIKIKEEEERKAAEEKQRIAEAEAEAQRIRNAEADAMHQDQQRKAKVEQKEREKQEREKQARERREQESRQKEWENQEQMTIRQQQQSAANADIKNPENADNILSPDFSLGLDNISSVDKLDEAIPNPTDILSLKYGSGNSNDAVTGDRGTDFSNETNNFYGKHDLLFDGLDMSFLGEDFGEDNVNSGNTGQEEEEFDIDNFLNQFEGT